MTMTASSYYPAAASQRDLHDRYLGFLGFTLAGYALLGKGFAYVGVPPLFIGEIALVLGLAAVLRTGCIVAVLAAPTSLCVGALLSWGIVRTAPFVGSFGVDALRDSVILGYGLFAFVVAALLLERPARLDRIVGTYARFAWLYGLVGGFLFLLSVNIGDGLKLPGSNIQLPYVRAGEAAVHLAGAAIFMLLGLGRSNAAWTTGLILSMAMVMPNRAAIITCLTPVALATLVGGQFWRLLPALLIGAFLLALAYALGVSIVLPNGRGIGAVQFVDSLASLVGGSKESNFDGTKEWRLRWWGTIQDYTIHGPYFWTGKGFGINLAVSDGFLLGEAGGGSSLRSPHNGHLTILARAGVPGLVLWMSTLAAWFWLLMRNRADARRRGETRWANLFLWMACYLTAFLINASFDVALEGPMLGIWFWCLFGLGLGASMIYRAMPAGAQLHPGRQGIVGSLDRRR